MGTVQFNCTNCQFPIIMGDKFWGRKVKCKECGEVLVVPSPASAEAEPASRSRISIEFVAIAVGVTVVVCLLAWVVFVRDTWEQDNRDRILTRLENANMMYLSNQQAEAVAEYEDVLKEIGTRVLTDIKLSHAFGEASQRVGAMRQTQAAAEAKRLAEAKGKKELEEKQAVAARSSGSYSSGTYSSSSSVPPGFVWTGDAKGDQQRLDFLRDLNSGKIRSFDDLETSVRKHSTEAEIRQMEAERLRRLLRQ